MDKPLFPCHLDLRLWCDCLSMFQENLVLNYICVHGWNKQDAQSRLQFCIQGLVLLITSLFSLQKVRGRERIEGNLSHQIVASVASSLFFSVSYFSTQNSFICLMKSYIIMLMLKTFLWSLKLLLKFIRCKVLSY